MSKRVIHINPSEMTLIDAAAEAHVTVATIRNWIKAGELKAASRGKICKKSFDQFMANVVGVRKLTKRANKLYRKKTNAENTVDILSIGRQSGDWDAVGCAYEASLSNATRNREGVYYTPREIIANMLRDIPVTDETTFLDPCCGSGNFLLHAVEMGIKPENIYGFDVDKTAVEIAQKRMEKKSGKPCETIFQCNFLDSAQELALGNKKFDLIFTNPPWGKKLDKKEKQQFAKVYDAGDSLDTSALFFFAAMRVLATDGYIGFLVQEAIFNIASFEDVRKRLLSHRIVRLIDYGKVFKGLMTSAQAFIVQHTPTNDTSISCEGKEAHERHQASFSTNPHHIFNFWLPTAEARRIDTIYAKPHTTLKDKATWGLGIVTGNNAKHCHSETSDDRIAVYKGADITAEGLKSPTTFISKDFSLYQQVAPIEHYQAPAKLIYKFISSKLVFYPDTQQRYILNSANFLIPHVTLGLTPQQLADLLNSATMNWLFTALFRTHKVLRRDLETLPIHVDYFEEYDVFSEDGFRKWLGIFI